MFQRLKPKPKRFLNKLYSCIQEMNTTLDKYVKRPGKDFTRPQTCTFSKMIVAIMAMECHDIDKEILQIFPGNMNNIVREDLVTQSAFVQARGKFNEDAFPYLFNEFNRVTPFTSTKDGLHMLGIDGSDYNIPIDIKDCNSFIPYNSRKGEYCQWHLNLAYDLLEDRYTDIVIQPRANMAEAAAACEMVDRKNIPGKCLYIMDRGYNCFNLMAHIMEKDDFFLIRVKEIHSSTSAFKLIAPDSDDEFDISHEFICSRSRKKHSKDPISYKYIRNDRRFDFIPEKDKESEYRIAIRLIGIKLDNGKMEYLITNLPTKKYPITKMKEYYHLRWKEETSFLHLKYGVALNYFHSIKRDFLVQEIYAKLTLYNFISLLVSCLEVPQNDTKHVYKVSFSDAINIGRLYLLGRISHSSVLELLLMHKTPVRPGRAYKRNMRSQRLKAFQNRS